MEIHSYHLWSRTRFHASEMLENCLDLEIKLTATDMLDTHCYLLSLTHP